MSLSLESTLAMLMAQSGQRRAQQAAQTQQTQQQGTQATSGAARCPCPATMAQNQQNRGQALSQFVGSGADASARTQSPAMPEQQPNPAALYAGEGTATPLARAQADGNLKTNQDLINHAYKQGGGTWAGASRVAQQLGVNLNDLVKNRQGRIGSALPTTEAPSSPVPSRPGQSATQAPSPATAPATTGATAPSGADLHGSQFGRSIANAAEREARRMNSVGRCALGVNNALISQGVPGRGHAYQKAEQLARNPRFREVNMSPSQLASLPAGAVVVWGRSAAKQYGHVSVALGDGREASDHVARQITSRGRYGTDFGNGPDPQGRVVRVFIPN
jgi:hypothetical protein